MLRRWYELRLLDLDSLAGFMVWQEAAPMMAPDVHRIPLVSYFIAL